MHLSATTTKYIDGQSNFSMCWILIEIATSICWSGLCSVDPQLERH